MGDDFYQRFAETYDAGEAQVIARRVVADLETPIGTYLKLAQGRTNTFLLESVQGGSTKGRYSIIGLDPDVVLRVRDGLAEINRSEVDHDIEGYGRPVEVCPERTAFPELLRAGECFVQHNAR